MDHRRGIAYTASPVLHDNKLYVVTDNGMISAFNATTGEPHYAQVRLPKAYNLKASPAGANGKLYVATEDPSLFRAVSCEFVDPDFRTKVENRNSD